MAKSPAGGRWSPSHSPRRSEQVRNAPRCLNTRIVQLGIVAEGLVHLLAMSGP